MLHIQQKPVNFLLRGDRLASNAASNLAIALEKNSLSALCFIAIAPEHREAIDILIKALPKNNVIALEFNGGKLSEENMKTMADNLPASQIINLNLTDITMLTNKSLKFIVDILPQSKVKGLFLCNTKISDSAIKILADYLRQSQLDTFYYTARLGEDSVDLIYKALYSDTCQVQNVILDSELHTEIAGNMISCRRVGYKPEGPATSVRSVSAVRTRANSTSSTSSDEPIFYDCPYSP
jgi:hypothetical protein